MMEFFYEHIFVYWSLSLTLLGFDFLFDKESKYKLQKPNVPDKWTNIFLLVFFNQILSLPLFWFFSDFKEESFFTFNNLYKIPFTFLTEEIVFYTLHRLLHRYFYNSIHKIHHRWNTPLGISTFYAHPLEHIFVNVFPVFLSAKITNLNKQTARVWHIFTLINSIIFSHGSYQIPFLKNMHNKHHQYFNCNYGAIGILDYMFNTLRFNK